MTTVLMFPGQSSRDPAMLTRIVSAWPPAAAVIAEASEILGRDLARHYRLDDPAMLARNRDIQVGVFLCSYLHQRALAARGVRGDLSLGLSLGEYNHLVHIGALDFPAALRLVDARGAAYDDGPEGMMASIFPMSAEEIELYLVRARAAGAVDIANLNSPSQNVIAGERAAVEAAIALIEDEAPEIQAVVIERRIPMHTSIFKPAADVLAPLLEAAPWQIPALPYIPNVLGEMIVEADGATIARLLRRHVYNPVRWRRSIDLLAARYPDARFVEVGPGAVLFNLLQRRWHANPRYRTRCRRLLHPRVQPGPCERRPWTLRRSSGWSGASGGVPSCWRTAAARPRTGRP
jgi:[acyl-carrier-protein] S-malonyltransferase